ncbi:uncharacterized protein LOC123500548 [Portunus trituberculatus]|uniref:uncharacterized protein LOC123500548 n=1 Tax=Portunus trituberculatus TaxID=210409 RepID=UPI001E1CFF27|nr:uncharacterized protein LOC123500548 [Portunus trituberculatus]
MYVGTNIIDGLTNALTMRRAHVGDRQFLELTVAKDFTGIDGFSPIYIGRGIIVSSITAWPVPHDAPYKHQLDRGIMAIAEAGLYEQWRKEMLENTMRDTRLKKREELRIDKDLGVKTAIESHEATDVLPLTVSHIQGPLIILLTGLFSGAMIFMTEKISA